MDKNERVRQFFVLKAPNPSGRDKRYYVGSSESFYDEYKIWSSRNGRAPSSSSRLTRPAYKMAGFQQFEALRRLERIGLLQGTMFESEVWKQHKALIAELIELEKKAPQSAEEGSFSLQRLLPIRTVHALEFEKERVKRG